MHEKNPLGCKKTKHLFFFKIKFIFENLDFSIFYGRKSDILIVSISYSVSLGSNIRQNC